LGWVTHRGPCQPLLFCDSVILWWDEAITALASTRHQEHPVPSSSLCCWHPQGSVNRSLRPHPRHSEPARDQHASPLSDSGRHPAVEWYCRRLKSRLGASGSHVLWKLLN